MTDSELALSICRKIRDDVLGYVRPGVIEVNLDLTDEEVAFITHHTEVEA